MEKEILKREEILLMYEKYKSFLTKKQALAIRLRYFEDLSFQEISEILKITKPASFDAVKQAKKKLYDIDRKIL